MKKRVLLIVPHPDDELSIGGLLLPNLNKLYEVYVMIVTNGDADCTADIRLKESLKGLNILGVKEEKIIFLGYGNRWNEEKHIYNMPQNKQTISVAGRTYTYALHGHEDYHYQKYHKHCKYTRHNLQRDMLECIMDILADVIICVDFDSHSDHRAVSLMFEEVMGKILHDTSYRPIVLKRFAYAFAWHSNISSCCNKLNRSEVFDNRFELDNPCYEWKRKISIYLSVFSIRLLLQLYLAALAYRSQNAKTHVRMLLKHDIVFWHRRTDSLLYDAEITVSSGEKKYLTDFKRFDCNDVNCSKPVSNFWNSCAWEPLHDDPEKCITIKMSQEKFVSSISICASIFNESIIKNCDIIIGQKVFHTGILFPGKEKIINIKEEKVSVIIIQITSYTGVKPGISEIEVYSEEKQSGLLKFQEKMIKKGLRR